MYIFNKSFAKKKKLGKIVLCEFVANFFVVKTGHSLALTVNKLTKADFDLVVWMV